MKRLPANIGALILIAAVVSSGCTDNPDNARAGSAQSQRSDTLVIPAGTSLVASLETQISTETNRTGDPFRATTTEPIIVDGITAIPTGARIHGVLRDVQASGHIEGRARMTLAYESIVDAQGKTHSISAQPLMLQAASTTRSDIEKIAAGSVIGGIIGGVAGGGKGAVIGVGAGAGAGVILMLATKGEDLELNPGQKLALNMTGSTSVQVPTGR